MAEKRDQHGKGPAHRLRAAGRVPAVLYGHGKAAVSLSTNAHDIAPMLHHTGLVTLKVEGRKRDVTAIIKDVQLDIIRGTVRHVDFQEVREDEVITAAIPIEPHGTPAGESQGGMLEQIMHEVEIKCAANRLPKAIRVEIGGMNVNDVITIKDLPLPEGAVADADPDQVVFSLVLPRVDAEAEAGEEAAGLAPEEGAAAEPEVIGKGKKEEEEEGESA